MAYKVQISKSGKSTKVKTWETNAAGVVRPDTVSLRYFNKSVNVSLTQNDVIVVEAEPQFEFRLVNVVTAYGQVTQEGYLDALTAAGMFCENF